MLLQLTCFSHQDVRKVNDAGQDLRVGHLTDQSLVLGRETRCPECLEPRSELVELLQLSEVEPELAPDRQKLPRQVDREYPGVFAVFFPEAVKHLLHQGWIEQHPQANDALEWDQLGCALDHRS